MTCFQDVFEIRYARMPEDRPPMETGGSGLGGTCDQSSAASDSGSESGPVTESLRERRLRELQLQVSSPLSCLHCATITNAV